VAGSCGYGNELTGAADISRVQKRPQDSQVVHCST